LRLDKFLSVSRLVKRRTVAAELCRGGRILVNGRPGKPGTQVEEGDQLELRLGKRALVVEIREIRASIRAELASGLYEVIRDDRLSDQ